MRITVIVGSVCFLAGLGLGAILTMLTDSSTSPGPEPEVIAPSAVLAAYTESSPEPEPEPITVEPAQALPDVKPQPAPVAPRFNPSERRELPPWMDSGMTNGPPPELRTNREAMMAWMAERQKERAAALRTNLVAKAELSEEQTVRFDVLMAALNLRLKEQSAKWREAMDSGVMTRAEVRARAMSEVNSAVVLTYDELDRNMPSGWREVAGNDFNVMTFIDPEVMYELRPIMRGGFRGGGGQGTNPPSSR